MSQTACCVCVCVCVCVLCTHMLKSYTPFYLTVKASPRPDWSCCTTSTLCTTTSLHVSSADVTPEEELTLCECQTEFWHELWNMILWNTNISWQKVQSFTSLKENIHSRINPAKWAEVLKSTHPLLQEKLRCWCNNRLWYKQLIVNTLIVELVTTTSPDSLNKSPDLKR